MEMMLRRMKIDERHDARLPLQLPRLGRERNRLPRELIETALAHVIGDKAEQAYRRSDALEKRRQLMEAWASYCAADPASEGRAVQGQDVGVFASAPPVDLRPAASSTVRHRPGAFVIC